MIGASGMAARETLESVSCRAVARHCVSAFMTPLGGVGGIDKVDRSARATHLVFDLSSCLTRRYIEEGSVQSRLLGDVRTWFFDSSPRRGSHVPGLEILKIDDVTAAYDIGSHLVLHILASAGELRLVTAQGAVRLCAISRPLLAAGNDP